MIEKMNDNVWKIHKKNLRSLVHDAKNPVRLRKIKSTNVLMKKNKRFKGGLHGKKEGKAQKRFKE